MNQRDETAALRGFSPPRRRGRPVSARAFGLDALRLPERSNDLTQSDERVPERLFGSTGQGMADKVKERAHERRDWN